MEEEMDHEMLEEQEHLDIVRTKAFSNPLIFLKILRCLTRKNLLECRKVSRVWCDLSTEVIGGVGIDFEYVNGMGCFILTPQSPTDDNSRTKIVDRPHWWFQDTLKKRHERIFRPQTTFIEDFYTLHSFTKMLSQNNAIEEGQHQNQNYQSPASLFSHFKIGFAGFFCQRITTNEPNSSKYASIHDRDILEFLSFHGSRIKELNIDLYGDDNGGSFAFLGVLLRRMVNVEKLNIGIHGPFVFRFSSESDREYDEEFERRGRWIEFAMERQLNFLHGGMLGEARRQPRRPNPLHELTSYLSNTQLPLLKMVLYHTHRYGSDNSDTIVNQETINGLAELKRILANISPNLKPEGQIETRRYPFSIEEHWATIFIPMQRADTVHKLSFIPNPTNLKAYEQFAKYHPKLSSIFFDWKAAIDSGVADNLEFQQRVLNILRKILISSSYTLKEIKGREEIENLGYLKEILPLLPIELTEDENQNINKKKDLMNTSKNTKQEEKNNNNNNDDDNNNNNSTIPISILEKIFKYYIPSSDLLSNTRLVNKEWCDISTKILLKRKAICINFIHYNHLHRFVRDKNAANKTTDMIREDSKYSFTEDFETLHSLNHILRRSIRKFPCVRFGLFNSILDSRDLKEFIELYGTQVKELELDLVDYSCKLPSKVLQFIQEELPNLELLTLSKTHATRRYNRGQFHRRTINNNVTPMLLISPICILKSQAFNDKESEKIWSDRIYSALVLEQLKLEFRQIQPCEFTIEKINSLRKNNSTDSPVTVNHLEFKYDAKGMDLNKFIMEMEDFISTKPKLWSVNFNFMNLMEMKCDKVSSQLLKLVEQVLKDNQHSLMDIQGLDQIGLISPQLSSYQQEQNKGRGRGGGEEEEENGCKNGLSTISFQNIRALTLNHVKNRGEISIVQKREYVDDDDEDSEDDGGLPLKKLCLGYESKLSHSRELSLSFLPQGWKIHSCFPNLVKVTLNYIDYVISEQDEKKQYYLDSLPNVSTLIIQNSGGPSWIKKVSQFFPNVNELTWIVKQPQDFSPLAPYMWEHFNGLKKLTLDFDWRSPIIFGPRDKLDGGFTGFSEETCIMMEDRNDKMKDVEVNLFRVNTSIFNLKVLSHLQMIFRDESPQDEPRNFWSSQVAGRYAFDKLSLKALIRLQVKTTKENQEKYQAVIAPFATYFYTEFEVVETQ